MSTPRTPSPEGVAPAEAPVAPPEPPTPVAIEDALTDEEATLLARTEAAGGSDADLWVFGLDSPIRAQEALLAAMRLVARDQLTLEDAAIVTKVRGRVRITQTKDMNPAQGAVGGAWVGILAGLFLGPGGPLVGGALGAAAGGLFAKVRDIGIDDDRMRTMGEDLPEGRAALFLLVEDCHRARALHEIGRFPGELILTTADEEVAAAVVDRLAVDPWDR